MMGPVSIIGASDAFSIARDVLVGMASIVTATVAILGLNRWSRELTGRAAFDVARGLIRATYKIRDQVQNFRSPFVAAGEFPAGYNGNTGDRKTEAEAWTHVYNGRWEPVWAALQDFDASTLEAETLWGPEIRTRTDELRKCVSKLRAAVGAIISDKAAGSEDFAANKGFGIAMRSIAVAPPPDDKNEFSDEINAAIAGIESQISPHLRRK